MNVKNLSLQQKDQLIAHLQQFVSENKKTLIEKVLSERTRHLTIALENIYQPHNASAVIRSAECFGIQDVHIIENDYEFSVRKGVVLGSRKWVTLKRYKHQTHNTETCLTQLKQQGYQLVATTLRNNSLPLSELDISQKTALLFGTEETGLSDIAHDMADCAVYVPMCGFTQSLNISVSAAICLHYLSEKIRKQTDNWPLSRDEKRNLQIEWLIKTAQNGERIVKQWLLSLDHDTRLDRFNEFQHDN